MLPADSVGSKHDGSGLVSCEYSIEIPIEQFYGSGRHSQKYNIILTIDNGII